MSAATRLRAGALGALLAGWLAASAALAAAPQKAIFAGGCFWCTEADFEKVPGVISARSGYTGGTAGKPSYEQVSAGGTGHAEAVEVTFDPDTISYEALLKVYWRSIDPTVKDRQFCDHGDQYRSAIFTLGAEQARLAQASKAGLEASGVLDATIQTQIVPAGPFYPAEEYHQDYYKKNPLRYQFYRYNCGRDQRLKKIWGDAKKD